MAFDVVGLPALYRDKSIFILSLYICIEKIKMKQSGRW